MYPQGAVRRLPVVMVDPSDTCGPPLPTFRGTHGELSRQHANSLVSESRYQSRWRPKHEQGGKACGLIHNQCRRSRSENFSERYRWGTQLLAATAMAEFRGLVAERPQDLAEPRSETPVWLPGGCSLGRKVECRSRWSVQRGPRGDKRQTGTFYD